MEIERKWLTDGWPQGLEETKRILMRQGYITTRPTVRIRSEQSGDVIQYVLCFKGAAGPDGLAGKGGQVLSQTVGLGFVGAQQHHRAARLLPDPGGKVGSVDGGQAGHRRRTAPRVESCQQAGKFRYPGEDLGE